MLSGNAAFGWTAVLFWLQQTQAVVEIYRGPGGKELYVTVVKDPNDQQAKGSIVRIPNVE